MTNTPLNPDAQTRRDIMAGLIGAWIDEWDDGKADTSHVATHIANRLAENGVTTLAVAQPEVNSVEELDQLPVGSVALDRFDYPHLKAMIALPEYLNLRTGARITRTEFYLPARVLYRPEVPGA